MTYHKLRELKEQNGTPGMPDDHPMDGVMRFDVSMFGLYGFMCYAHAESIGVIAGFLTTQEFDEQINILGSRVRDAINAEIRKYVLEHAPHLDSDLVEGKIFHSMIRSDSMMTHRQFIHWELH